jgi:predicted alpha/beta hydrolase
VSAERGQSVTLTAVDGEPLAARCFEGPPGHDGPVVVIASATGVPQGFYARYAHDLATRGFTVYTLDYRGLGESLTRPLADTRVDLQGWALDLQVLVDHVDRTHPGRPVVWVGHSFGGQALALIRPPERLVGVLTVGGQLAYLGHWPGADRAGLTLVWWLAVPALARLVGYLPGRAGLGADLPAGVAREWARWCRSPGYLFDHVPGATARLRALTVPVRILHVSDDRYAPPRAMQAMAQRFPTSRVDLLRPSDLGLSRIGHFGLLRPGCEAAWDDLAATYRRWAEG